MLLLSLTLCCVIDYTAKFAQFGRGVREQKNPLSYSPLGNTEVDCKSMRYYSNRISC